jgi:hypothetical protein
MVLFLNRHFKKQFGLLYLCPGILPALDNFLNLAKLFLDFLGACGIAPEIGSQRLAFKLLNFFFFAG